MLVSMSIADSDAYRSAVSLYEEVRLEEADAVFASLVDGASEPADRALLLVWRALVLTQMQEPEQARELLAKALAADPKVSLPTSAPPELSTTLEELRAALPAVVVEPMPATLPPKFSVADRAGTDSSPWLGFSLVGVGVVFVAAGAVLFGVGLNDAFNNAYNSTPFNDEALAIVRTAYVEYAIAGALAGTGAVGIVAGAVVSAD